jgi:transposase
MLDILLVHRGAMRSATKIELPDLRGDCSGGYAAKAVAGGKATFATLAHVVVSNLEHHLPLYRQSEMVAAQGLDIDGSLAGRTGQPTAPIVPIVSRIREEALELAQQPAKPVAQAA